MECFFQNWKVKRLEKSLLLEKNQIIKMAFFLCKCFLLLKAFFQLLQKQLSTLTLNEYINIKKLKNV